MIIDFYKIVCFNTAIMTDPVADRLAAFLPGPTAEEKAFLAFHNADLRAKAAKKTKEFEEAHKKLDNILDIAFAVADAALDIDLDPNVAIYVRTGKVRKQHTLFTRGWTLRPLPPIRGDGGLLNKPRILPETVVDTDGRLFRYTLSTADQKIEDLAQSRRVFTEPPFEITEEYQPSPQKNLLDLIDNENAALTRFCVDQAVLLNGFVQRNHLSL
jgi:hypothetical protein